VAKQLFGTDGIRGVAGSILSIRDHLRIRRGAGGSHGYGEILWAPIRASPARGLRIGGGASSGAARECAMRRGHHSGIAT